MEIRDRKKGIIEENYRMNTEKNYAGGQQKPASADRSQDKTDKYVLCFYCSKLFKARGTRKYCYGELCKTEAKRCRQSIVDGLVSKMRKGMYANLKIFLEKLPKPGQTKMDYDDALKKGFDEYAYYGTYKNKNLLWHVVEQYYFLIEHTEDKRFLHIYKK